MYKYESWRACLETLPGQFPPQALAGMPKRFAFAVQGRGKERGRWKPGSLRRSHWKDYCVELAQVLVCGSFVEAWPRAGESSVLWHPFWPRSALLAADDVLLGPFSVCAWAGLGEPEA